MKKIRLILAAMTAVSAIYMILRQLERPGLSSLYHGFHGGTPGSSYLPVVDFCVFHFAGGQYSGSCPGKKAERKKIQIALPVERFAARRTSSAKNAAILLQKPAEFLLEESAVWI